MKSLRPLSRLVPLLALALFGAACQEGSSTVDVETDHSLTSGGGLSTAGVLAKLPHSAQVSIRHSGVRVFQSQDWSTDTPHLTKFREQFHTDGQGKYAILPVEEIEGARPDWAVFRLLLEIRQGLNFKYRDFAVHDTVLFQQNWMLASLPTQDIVAGRLVDVYQVNRSTGTDRRYTVSIDVETGLVLRYVEQDSIDRVLSKLEYETVDYDPDLSSVLWYQEDVRQQIDLTRSYEDQVGFEPLVPSLLPSGYCLRKAEVAVDEGREWLKMEYTDGVDFLFFLQRFPSLQLHGGGSSTLGGLGGLRDMDRIFSLRIGSAWALEGTIGGQGLIAVGKVSEVELADMLQSALD